MSGPVQSTEPSARPEGWWAYPGVYAVAVYVIGFVPNLAWWAAPSIGVVLALLGRVLARYAYHPRTHGENFSWWAQLLGVLAGLGAGAWLWGAQIVGGPLVAWPWLVYGSAALGLGQLLLLWIAPSAERAHAQGPASTAPDVSLQVLYQGILKRAGSTDVLVTEVRISPSGGVESVYLTPALPVEGEKPKPLITRDGFTGGLPKIVVELDRTLRKRAKPAYIHDQDVHVEQGRGGSEWIMHVTVARPLNVTTAFVPAETPQPWCGPKKVGRYEDDAPMFITFCDEQEGAAHSEGVIKTGGGKTGALNTIIARHLEGGQQGRVWIVGTNKCIKLARPWLEPWLRGQTDRPVIDWVAGEDIQAVLRALASAYQYAVECNRATKGNRARKPVAGAGALAVFMDEASDTLMRSETILCCDGVRRNASALADRIQAVGRSGPVSLHKMNQNALLDSFGPNGAQQRRNIGIGIAGQCKAPQDAQRVIPGLPRANPTLLRNQAVFVEQSYEEPRELRARFGFIEDDEIPGLATRYTPWQGPLDPRITARMPYYADRWDREWHGMLIREIEAEGLAWPSATPHTEAAPSMVKQQDDTREESAVTHAYRDPEELVDLWDLFNSEQTPAADAPASTSSFSNPDPSDMVAGFRKMAEWVRDREAQQAATATPGVPEPLGIVIALLDLPHAPTDWVSTEVLTYASQRVAPTADAESKRRAIEQFGRDLVAQDALLSTQKCQRRVNGDRKWGYPVEALRAAADRARRRQ